MFSQISLLLMPVFLGGFNLTVVIERASCFHAFLLSPVAHQQWKQDVGLELEKNKL